MDERKKKPNLSGQEKSVTNEMEGPIASGSAVEAGEIKQFVIFQLENEEYGIPILQVRSVERLSPVTRVPEMPNFLKGVINLRGDLVPILDLREKFGAQLGDEAEVRIVISKPIEGQVFGMVVNSVSEILKVPAADISVLPPSMTKIRRQYLTGAAKVRDRLIVLLDLKSILSEMERAELAEMSSKLGEQSAESRKAQ